MEKDNVKKEGWKCKSGNWVFSGPGFFSGAGFLGSIPISAPFWKFQIPVFANFCGQKWARKRKKEAIPFWCVRINIYSKTRTCHAPVTRMSRARKYRENGLFSTPKFLLQKRSPKKHAKIHIENCHQSLFWPKMGYFNVLRHGAMITFKAKNREVIRLDKGSQLSEVPFLYVRYTKPIK